MDDHQITSGILCKLPARLRRNVLCISYLSSLRIESGTTFREPKGCRDKRYDWQPFSPSKHTFPLVYHSLSRGGCRCTGRRCVHQYTDTRVAFVEGRANLSLKRRTLAFC